MKKILVANRGEIALRVMKTIKKWESRPLRSFLKPIGMRRM